MVDIIQFIVTTSLSIMISNQSYIIVMTYVANKMLFQCPLFDGTKKTRTNSRLSFNISPINPPLASSCIHLPPNRRQVDRVLSGAYHHIIWL
jgi:hypothetical protein